MEMTLDKGHGRLYLKSSMIRHIGLYHGIKFCLPKIVLECPFLN